MILRQLLALLSNRIYITEDLADFKVLDRALRVLYGARLG